MFNNFKTAKDENASGDFLLFYQAHQVKKIYGVLYVERHDLVLGIANHCNHGWGTKDLLGRPKSWSTKSFKRREGQIQANV